MDEIDYVGALANPYDKIARFEILVNEIVRMNVLQAMTLDIKDISPLVKSDR